MSEIFLPLRPRRDDEAAAMVVQNNLEYLMQLFEKGLNDGDILVWNALLGRFVAEPAGGVQVVTSFPLAPIPGQEIVLTDSLSSPTYHWALRYNADSASSYKWECMGGTPGVVVTGAGGQQTTTSTTFTDLTTTGPDFTLPTGVGGDFLVQVGASIANSDAPAGRVSLMSYALGATGAGDDGAARSQSSGQVSVMSSRRKTSIASGALIRCKYRTTNAAGTASFENDRWLSVFPYRVG
jgi:hypothetical protein